jgi:Na+/melibiose symporter-like transporter
MDKTALVIVMVAFAGICLGVYGYVRTVEPFRDKWRTGRRAFTLPVAAGLMVIAAALTATGH